MDGLADRMQLVRSFPRLELGNFRITSPVDRSYNCVAWACGDQRRHWWPVGSVNGYHWPAGVAREETIEAFRQALLTLGYARTLSQDPEEGVEKIAVFAKDGVPAHVARQLPSGLWTSKLGFSYDIEHRLGDLECDVYGKVALLMSRPRSESITENPTQENTTP